MKPPRRSMRLRTFAVLFLVTSLPLGGAVQAQAVEPRGYALRSGDRMEIDLHTSARDEVTVVDGECYVDVNGDMFLPIVGRLNVLGMDQAAIRFELRRLCEDLWDRAHDIGPAIWSILSGAQLPRIFVGAEPG